jgi:hypothetical protein
MKNLLIALLLVSTLQSAFAKKVKFAVDLTGQVISPNGVHITGDFQELAGFPGGDWTSDQTSLTQEGTSDIYSIVVEIPAFRKYEYKFLNGDQFYEAEFVPVESRVGYNFNDNRWIYVDSLSTDTFFVGAIQFAANAPAGLNLVRLLVDMQNESVASSGVHVAGSFQNGNYTASILYSFEPKVYEAIYFVPAGTIDYKYVNGNASSNSETVPSACASSGSNRQIPVQNDTVLAVHCFASCEACTSVGIKETESNNSAKLIPNPTNSTSQLVLNKVAAGDKVFVTNLLGSVVGEYSSVNGNLTLSRNNLSNGVYFVNVQHTDNSHSTIKWIIE